jgi:hypothetical protein
VKLGWLSRRGDGLMGMKEMNASLDLFSPLSLLTYSSGTTATFKENQPKSNSAFKKFEDLKHKI